MKEKDCAHTEFEVSTIVHRLQETEDGPVLAYAAEVHIRCMNCKLDFRFKGKEYGVSALTPTLSADGLELRVPLEPADEEYLFGNPVRVFGQKCGKHLN